MPTYKLQKGFVVQKFTKKLVLFDSETSTMYTLNETAAFIFNKLKAGFSKKEIVQSLTRRFSAAEKRATKDLEEAISMLIRAKIFTKP